MNHSEFRAIFEEHVAFVWRVLARHGVPRSELEDTCQEVFLALYQSLSKFEGRSSLRTWLYGIAVRVAFALRRKALRRQERQASVEVEGECPAHQFQALYSRELHQQLMAALATLSRQRREVFVLYEVDGMPIAEAAQALGIAENTALYRLHAAREAIASFVRKQEKNPKSALVRRSRVEVA